MTSGSTVEQEALKVYETIGPLHNLVTLYILLVSKLNSRTSKTEAGALFWKSHALCNLLTSICNFVPCDRVLQRATQPEPPNVFLPITRRVQNKRIGIALRPVTRRI